MAAYNVEVLWKKLSLFSKTGHCDSTVFAVQQNRDVAQRVDLCNSSVGTTVHCVEIRVSALLQWPCASFCRVKPTGGCSCPGWTSLNQIAICISRTAASLCWFQQFLPADRARCRRASPLESQRVWRSCVCFEMPQFSLSVVQVTW